MKVSRGLQVVGFIVMAAGVARAESHGGLVERPEAPRQVAPSKEATRIVGCVGKDNEGEFLSFDLALGTSGNQYQMKGSTNPDQGVYQSDSNYDGVLVTKHQIENGLTRIRSLDNAGTVKIFPRKRKMEGVVLAGVPIGGYSVQKLFTNSLTMDQLDVGGAPAKGKLFYNPFTGTYSCPSGACSFGEYALQSSQRGSKILLNYDNFINRNRMRVSMGFGDLVLDGAIKFTDTKNVSAYTDSDGDTHSSTTVAATKGCFNVELKKKNGQGLVLAGYGQKETEDDRTVRHLMAWLQLMTYDLFSE